MQINDNRYYHATIEDQEMMHQNPGRTDYADAKLETVKVYQLKHKI